MSGGRWTKHIPEFIYFIGNGEWIMGPYVKKQRGHVNRKFKLVEMEMDKECPYGKGIAKQCTPGRIDCEYKHLCGKS
jgi:hypothetical protein